MVRPTYLAYFVATAAAIGLCVTLRADGPDLIDGQRLRDPATPRRPEALVSVRTADAPAVLLRIKSELVAAGFAVTRLARENGEIGASRTFDSEQDRVFIWLERSYSSPTEVLDLHCNFEHIAKVIGSDSGMAIMPISSQEETARFGPLRNRLLLLAQEKWS